MVAEIGSYFAAAVAGPGSPTHAIFLLSFYATQIISQYDLVTSARALPHVKNRAASNPPKPH
jgi:hypothetical protein